MTLAQIVFYLLAAFTLVMAWLSVSARQLFRSAIWLLFALVGVAGIYFWMEMEFIAAVQIVVYVGGVVVLIIFSIFLTNQSGDDMPLAGIRRRIAAALAVLFGIGFTASLVAGQSFTASTQVFDNEVSRIGHAMLDTGVGGYALPFEAVSLLLLAAMVGCIVIAMKDGGKEKINSAATAAATEQNQQ